jgi:hypothetical protein
MSWHRSSGFCAVAIVALALLTAGPALGAVAGIDRELLVGTGGGHPGDADFGSGFHANGNPTGPYTVTWNFTPSDGVVRVNARIKGTRYVDRIGSGCVLRLHPHRQPDYPVLRSGFRREQLGQSAGRDVNTAVFLNFPAVTSS